jgi:hypothetical protein
MLKLRHGEGLCVVTPDVFPSCVLSARPGFGGTSANPDDKIFINSLDDRNVTRTATGFTRKTGK